MVYNCKKLFPFLDTSNSQILQIQLNLREPTVPYFIGHLRAHTGLPWPLSSYTRSRPARKDATNRNLLRQKLYCLHLQEQESKSKRENGETPSLFKENYPPPRTCHSLIGCSPSAELSSRGRQSTWSGELPLAHAQIICLPLRTQLSAPSYNGECEGGSSHKGKGQVGGLTPLIASRSVLWTQTLLPHVSHIRMGCEPQTSFLPEVVFCRLFGHRSDKNN
jgi:hypothetical protein